MLAISGKVKCQTAGSAADIKHAVSVRQATKSDQQGARGSAAPPSHDFFVAFSILETRQRRAVDIGKWASLNP